MHKTLIIPDIHNKVSIADRIHKKEKPDRTVCLGDYLDDYGDGVEEAIRTARWMRDKIEEGWELIIGNHDAAYLARSFSKTCDPAPFRCPGYSRNKADAVNKIMRHIHWSSMKLWTMVGKYVCSHAGFNTRFVHAQQGLTEDWLRQKHATVFKDTFLDMNPWNIVTACGPSRGGLDPYGGILWQDWMEFKAIPGVNQIVGHTQGIEPRYAITQTSTNICLDTNLLYYITVENPGLLRIHKTFEQHHVQIGL